MKKIIAVVMVLVLMSILCACGNMQIIGEYKYTHIYVETYKTKGRCFGVERWTDNESGGIEVLTEDHGSMFLSEGTYILISDKDKCPFCGEVEE